MILGPNVGSKQARTVAEVYNPNRFGARAPKHDLNPGEAFDLELGHDLTREPSRRAVREYLHTHKPGLVCVSPPCTMLSMLQNLSEHLRQQDPEKMRIFQKRLKEAKLLLGFAIEICASVHAYGGTFFCLNTHGLPRHGKIPVGGPFWRIPPFT